MPFIEAASRRHLAVALALAAGLLALFFHGDCQRWPALLAGGIVISRIFGAYCRFRAGGVTGDMLGAGSEIVETIVLAAGAAMTYI